MAFRTNKTPVLQEKSASGSVATFNTALAMPLSSCNIAVNAWQEGSGDPSPDNVRPIHGFSEINATRAGKNYFGGLTFANSLNGITTDYNLDTANKIVSFSHSTKSDSGSYIHPIFNKFKSNTRYTIIFYAKTRNENVSSSNIRIGYSDRSNSTILVNSTERTLYIFTTTANKSVKDLTIAYNNNVLIDVYYDTFGVFEGIVTIDDFEPYTGNTYTIQLGQEVYGAEVDVVNGVAHCTHGLAVFEGSSAEHWFNYLAGNGYYITLSDMDILNNGDVICNWLNKYSGVSNLGIRLGFDNNVVYAYQVNTISGVSDLTSWADYLSNNPLEVVYPLATPFDIQLTPTQIETLIGNNTIFADTGDIDLTYKDLGIAKRGNFREVFKLPS